jgi:hypothetical protein
VLVEARGFGKVRRKSSIEARGERDKNSETQRETEGQTEKGGGGGGGGNDGGSRRGRSRKPSCSK